MEDTIGRDLLDHAKQRMKGMWPKVWKVRAWVHKSSRKGMEQVHSFEEVFLTESAALHRYADQVCSVKGYTCYANHTGKVELFIPHVFDNGTLAYWPDADGYIERYDSKEEGR